MRKRNGHHERISIYVRLLSYRTIWLLFPNSPMHNRLCPLTSLALVPCTAILVPSLPSQSWSQGFCISFPSSPPTSPGIRLMSQFLISLGSSTALWYYSVIPEIFYLLVFHISPPSIKDPLHSFKPLAVVFLDIVMTRSHPWTDRRLKLVGGEQFQTWSWFSSRIVKEYPVVQENWDFSSNLSLPLKVSWSIKPSVLQAVSRFYVCQ